MATTGNIIQRVIGLYEKGAPSRASRLMRRHVYAKLLTVRALLLFNKVNKRQFLSKWNYTFIPCIELILIPENDCPCIVPVGCQILRSKNKLPKPISSINKHLIDGVMSVDGSVSFAEVTYKSKRWANGSKYSSTRPDYFIKDDYIYVTILKKIKAISVYGIFSSPLEAENFPSICDNDSTECTSSPMELEFPLEEAMVDALVQLTVQELVTGFPLGNEDRRNDNVDKLDHSATKTQRRSE